jgi:glycogen debranching enzyme
VLTVLEGSTFCISDEWGDVGERSSGFFAEDTRFLSRFALRLDGERPLLLSSRRVDYFSAAFYLRNQAAGGLAVDSVSVARARFVGEGMQERIALENHTGDPVRLRLSLLLEADFADIITVKEHDFALGDPAHARPLPGPAPRRFDAASDELVFSDPESDLCTQLVFSRPGRPHEDGVDFDVSLGPRQRWELRVDVACGAGDSLDNPHVVSLRFGDELEHVRASLAAWHLRVPRLRASPAGLQRTWERSVADLASLRMRGSRGAGRLPAAGMPWFMTVFGRDTLITSLQTLLFGPELAEAAVESLADLQADRDDPAIDAEPGKIVHELRRGKCAERWFARYYGTVDATPLFLVLLSELWRWTGDELVPTRLEANALRALEWIDRWGDRDGDGFVEYERRTPRGLANQSWKDSGDSQRFADGRFAEGPIAPCEVQGYVYDAKLRTAELARAVWGDAALADRLELEAAELRERFDEAFWLDERGGYFALALDGDKRPVDSLTSNIGHLLWSGIVKPERVGAVVERLLGPELWSGWGVRTMSTGDAAYNPLAYHNGTVWPHDSSLIALGLERCGRREEAVQLAERLLAAAEQFDHELPEVFAGMARSETLFPIAYPTAARPQAWAAGAPVLLLQVLLGLRPDPRRAALVSDADALPAWAGSVELLGVRAYGRAWDVVADGERVQVREQV